MDQLDVKIVNLEPRRVASAYAYGDSPENAAAEQLIEWAGPLGLLKGEAGTRIFGFNNPNPSPGSPNYGYEYWITIKESLIPAGKIKIKDFNGGRYAVTRCRVEKGNFELISTTWKNLMVWCESRGRYRLGHHQWLEEHLGPFAIANDLTLDLYLPIVE
jgi:DNA gyrase inhibitor GyrI